MRVTPGMTADNALYNLQQGRSKLDAIQEQVASGYVINRPSDDPLSTRQILDLEDKLKEGTQYASNITKGNLWLNVTNTTLSGISDVIALAKKVTADIAGGTTDVTVRTAATSQLDELKKRLVDLGNTRLGDQYIFAGFKNDVPPFSDASNAFGGTEDSMTVEIDKNSFVGMNVSGGALFKGTGSYGSTDILQSIDDVIAAINANNVAGIQTGVKAMAAAAIQVTNAQADLGGRMVRTEAAKNMVDRNQYTLKTMISNMQDIDIAKAAVELNQQQTAFQAALSTTAKVTSLSLLDYLK